MHEVYGKHRSEQISVWLRTINLPVQGRGLFPTAGFRRAAAGVVLLLLRQDKPTSVCQKNGKGSRFPTVIDPHEDDATHFTPLPCKRYVSPLLLISTTSQFLAGTQPCRGATKRIRRLVQLPYKQNTAGRIPHRSTTAKIKPTNATCIYPVP